MMQDPCEEMRLLVQADADGELDAGQAALVAAHVAGCAGCARLQGEMAELRQTLRAGLPYHTPPATLRSRLARLVAPPPAAPRPWHRLRGSWAALSGGFVAGGALAAAITLVVVAPGQPSLLDAVIAGHVRALQPGHLIDVRSTDQHTVKPWLDARLDYAPPVKNLARQGFPLQGGRLDYIDGRTVGVMVYRHALHEIDLYVWPGRDGPKAPALETRNGWHVVNWVQDGMSYRAVSDLNAAELMRFVADWRATPP